MKQFFKFMLASIVGFFVSSLLMLFLIIGLIVGSISSALSKKEVFQVNPNSVLHLTLDNTIVDRTTEDPFDSFDWFSMQPVRGIGLNEIIRNVERAKTDPNISGILLDLTYVDAGWSTIAEIRQKLHDFKQSGKFVVSYGEVFSQGAYYLASVADEVYLHPEGSVGLMGLNAEMVFFKNTLEKLGIEAQVIRHGDFKSAGEPFYLEKMSRENRLQIESFLNSIWGNVISDISDSRGINPEDLLKVVDGFLARNPDLAIEHKIIDGKMHRDQVMDLLKDKLGLKETADVNLAALNNYRNSQFQITASLNRIAVIYGTGAIMQGSGSETVIGSDRMAEAIRKARTDKTVKAIVLRINSPGGSALASDIILREVELARSEKPVVVSMGDVAASGGYYIASKADYIVANPSTITGSIGVFGVIPNMKNFFNQKLGITFDNVKTNELADFASVNRPLTNREKFIIQEEIGRVYETFTSHVAEGRDMTIEEVDQIGRGRVWSGAEALELGLVDELGGLDLAIYVAAEKAGIENYMVKELPEQRNFLQRLFDDLGGLKEKQIQNQLGQAFHYLKIIESANNTTGLLMRLPFDIKIE